MSKGLFELTWYDGTSKEMCERILFLSSWFDPNDRTWGVGVYFTANKCYRVREVQLIVLSYETEKNCCGYSEAIVEAVLWRIC